MREKVQELLNVGDIDGAAEYIKQLLKEGVGPIISV